MIMEWTCKRDRNCGLVVVCVQLVKGSSLLIYGFMGLRHP